MLKDRKFLGIYAIIAVLVVCSKYIGASTPELEWVAKPMIVLSLLLHYITQSNIRNVGFIVALFFGLLGDLFLMFDNYFLAGLASFLIGHLFYIYYFSSYLKKQGHSIRWIYLLPLGILYVLFMFLILPGLDHDLKIPVALYTIVILGFLFVILNTKKMVNNSTSTLLINGATLFVCSDAMIAIHHFYAPQAWGPYFIILSYMLAQLLLTAGALGLENETFNKGRAKINRP